VRSRDYLRVLVRSRSYRKKLKQLYGSHTYNLDMLLLSAGLYMAAGLSCQDINNTTHYGILHNLRHLEKLIESGAIS
jgi:hypothetical protein